MPEIIITPEQLSKLTGQTPEAITTAIATDDGGVDPVKAIDLIAQTINSKVKKRGEDKYQEAWKAAHAKLESSIKEKFGVTDFDNAESAIEAAAQIFADAKAGKGKADPAHLTIEQLSKLPQFEEATKQLRQAMENAAKERDEARHAFTYYKTMQTAKSKAESYLEQKNAHYGTAGKDRALSLLFTDLTAQGFNLTLDESGNLAILDREGKTAVDEFHNPLNFETIIEKSWPFGFNTAPNGGNPNAPDKSGGAGGSGEGTANKYGAWTIESLKDAVKDPSTDTKELPLMFRALADKQANAK